MSPLPRPIAKFGEQLARSEAATRRLPANSARCARPLRTVMQACWTTIGFAPPIAAKLVKIEAVYMHEHVGDIAKNADF